MDRPSTHWGSPQMRRLPFALCAVHVSVHWCRRSFNASGHECYPGTRCQHHREAVVPPLPAPPASCSRGAGAESPFEVASRISQLRPGMGGTSAAPAEALRVPSVGAANSEAAHREPCTSALRGAPQRRPSFAAELIHRVPALAAEPFSTFLFRWEATPLELQQLFDPKEANHLNLRSDVQWLAQNVRYTAAHFAAATGNVPLLQMLRECRECGAAGLCSPDTHGNHPLHFAAMFGEDAAVSWLLDREPAEAKAAGSDGRTALHFACIHGHNNVLRAFASAGAISAHPQLLQQRDRSECDPVAAAAASGHVATIELLAEMGAPLLSFDKRQRTAVHHAADAGMHESVAFLAHELGLEYLSGVDRAGATPAHHAARRARIPVLETLLAHGVDIDVPDKTGRTPLWWCVLESKKKSHVDATAFLLKCGVRLFARDSTGATITRACAQQHGTACRMYKLLAEIVPSQH